MVTIDIIYIDAALAAGNEKCGRHLGPVILLVALQQKTQDASTMQHVPAQIDEPSQTGLGGFTFLKTTALLKETVNELNSLLTSLELRKVQLFIAVLEGICYTVTEYLIYELHLHHLHSPLCVPFPHRLVDSVLF
ncbi:hypothetical protein AALO_G00144440 [Alosa alosa]|uniref:Uncharacterized protein n=1 Tax=Alosa alosa TaxID=278164 RepID=A0AAV6GIX6_9TELE|nr:hypothetical protein AALO_G00144440 [Alosa alosa]